MEWWKQWLQTHVHLLILMLLWFATLILIVHLVHAGAAAASTLEWAKQQFSAILGAILFSLQAPRSGGPPEPR